MDDLPRREIKIPEWGNKSVFIRTLSAGERDQFEASLTDRTTNIRARLAVMCLCDEDGSPLFTQDKVEALAKKSGKALDRVFDAAIHLNKISKEDVEELEKNSPAGQSGAPCSNS